VSACIKVSSLPYNPIVSSEDVGSSLALLNFNSLASKAAAAAADPSTGEHGPTRATVCGTLWVALLAPKAQLAMTQQLGCMATLARPGKAQSCSQHLTVP
jgi:hypothetical protein